MFQFGICCTRTSFFVHQVQNLIFVGELPAHLTTAHGRAVVTDANRYNRKQKTGILVWKKQNKHIKLLQNPNQHVKVQRCDSVHDITDFIVCFVDRFLLL